MGHSRPHLAPPGEFPGPYVANASSTTGCPHIIYNPRSYSLTDRSSHPPASRAPATYLDPPVYSTTTVPVSNVSPSTQAPPSNKVEGTFLPSAFVGQPIGVDQVGDLWIIGDSRPACPTTNNAELMYDTRLSPPNRSRIIFGGGSTKKKVEFIGKIDMFFQSKTKISATLYDVSFEPGLIFFVPHTRKPRNYFEQNWSSPHGRSINVSS